ncbi:MAG: hypothetical protein ACKOFY_05360 [Candidatus Limnocylindrus sp.]
MYKARWSLALLVGLLAACGAPSTAIAPSRVPIADSAGISMRPITVVAAEILSPLELRGLVARPFTLVRSESGEQRTRQVLVSSDGVEVLRMESALDGSLRLITRSGVALENAAMSESAAIGRALRQLLRLGLEMPGGDSAVRSAAGRTLVLWERQVRGVPVPGDGIRVVLNGSGELVGVAVEESPLAAAPTVIARRDAALRAASALLPSGALVDDVPELAWVHSREGADEMLSQRVPRRLAWCVRGSLRDSAAFELQFDAGSLVLLGWDGAP